MPGLAVIYQCPECEERYLGVFSRLGGAAGTV